MVNDKRPDDFIEPQEQDTEGHLHSADGADEEKDTESTDDEDTEGPNLRS